MLNVVKYSKTGNHRYVIYDLSGEKETVYENVGEKNVINYLISEYGLYIEIRGDIEINRRKKFYRRYINKYGYMLINHNSRILIDVVSCDNIKYVVLDKTMNPCLPQKLVNILKPLIRKEKILRVLNRIKND